MINLKRMKIKFYKFTGILALGFFTCAAQASQTGTLPWEATLTKIMDSLDGPVAYACAGIAIVISGLGMAFLDLSGGAKKFVQAAVGISIAFGVVVLLNTFFTFSGATVM